MTHTANYPATKEQFTAHCAALCALVNSKYQTSRTSEVYNKRLTAANLAIERMRRFYAANPTSTVAPAILSRANEMQAELDAALTRTAPATATESGQEMILFLLAVIAIIVCLVLLYGVISEVATGTTNLFATMLNGIASAIK